MTNAERYEEMDVVFNNTGLYHVIKNMIANERGIFPSEVPNDLIEKSFLEGKYKDVKICYSFGDYIENGKKIYTIETHLEIDGMWYYSNVNNY